MVRIRLRRVGAKKQPHYRVVVADQRSPRDGRHIETIGYYNPRTEPETVKIKEDRALYWLGKGAQPSDPVLRFLNKQGTMDRLARLKSGEALEALVAEYEASAAVEESAEPEKAEPVAQTVPEVEAEIAEAEAGEAEAVEPEAEEAEPVAQAVPEVEAEIAEAEAGAAEAAEPETEEVKPVAQAVPEVEAEIAEADAGEVEAVEPEAEEAQPVAQAMPEVEAEIAEADEAEAVEPEAPAEA
jgi:small subunit ribosomal protein S16